MDLPATFDFNVEQPISTDIALYGGVFAKRHVIPKAGTYVPQHAHSYDHLSLLAAGALRAWCDGVLVGDFIAPAEIRIPANTKHTFLALADATTFYCLHNTEHFDEVERHELPGFTPPPVAPDENGFCFQQEPFDAWLGDAERLIDQHQARVDEVPGTWREKNIPLMRRLAAAGALHITTVRCNGRMFGYLMAVVSPTLYSAARVEAMHTAFYCSPDATGLGLKLQRASIDFLRSTGVTEVLFRAGTKGDGPRLGALFRRLGAVPSGDMYYLDLAETT